MTNKRWEPFTASMVGSVGAVWGAGYLYAEVLTDGWMLAPKIVSAVLMVGGLVLWNVVSFPCGSTEALEDCPDCGHEASRHRKAGGKWDYCTVPMCTCKSRVASGPHWVRGKKSRA